MIRITATLALAFLPHLQMLLCMTPAWMSGVASANASDPQEVTPEMLEDEAKALATRVDLTVIGKKGLIIRGTNLEGDGVKRPSMLMARAAELYAERALATGDFRWLNSREKALHIWRDLQDWKTPIGYLRQFRMTFGKAKPSLATACDFEIAQCYEHQGDLSTEPSAINNGGPDKPSTDAAIAPTSSMTPATATSSRKITSSK